MKPFSASGCSNRSITMRTTTSSGTRSPRSMKALASRPSGVSFVTFSRKMSPVPIRTTSNRSSSRWACVPFPAPGGPRSTSRMTLPEEALVVPHQQLRLQLLHRLERDTDRDEDRRPPERELLDVPCVQHDVRDQRDRREEDRTRERDTNQ